MDMDTAELPWPSHAWWRGAEEDKSVGRRQMRGSHK